MASISELRRASQARRMEAIRHMVDDVARTIQNGSADEAAARELARSVRFQVSLLIPDQMETYDLIYSSRFERLIRQFIRGES